MEDVNAAAKEELRKRLQEAVTEEAVEPPSEQRRKQMEEHKKKIEEDPLPMSKEARKSLEDRGVKLPTARKKLPKKKLNAPQLGEDPTDSFSYEWEAEMDSPCLFPGQKYALISVAGPTDVKLKSDKWALRIWGTCNSRKEIAQRIEYIRELNPYARYWDIFAIELGGWALFPPHLDSIEDRHYQQDELKNIMSKNMENLKEAKQFHNKRRTERTDINKEIRSERDGQLLEQRRKKLILRKAASLGVSPDLLTPDQRDEVEKELHVLLERIHEKKSIAEAAAKLNTEGTKEVVETRENEDGSTSYVRKKKRVRRVKRMPKPQQVQAEGVPTGSNPSLSSSEEEA